MVKNGARSKNMGTNWPNAHVFSVGASPSLEDRQNRDSPYIRSSMMVTAHQIHQNDVKIMSKVIESMERTMRWNLWLTVGPKMSLNNLLSNLYALRMRENMGINAEP